jgi:hypothetical protein
VVTHAYCLGFNTRHSERAIFVVDWSLNARLRDCLVHAAAEDSKEALSLDRLLEALALVYAQPPQGLALFPDRDEQVWSRSCLDQAQSEPFQRKA